MKTTSALAENLDAARAELQRINGCMEVARTEIESLSTPIEVARVRCDWREEQRLRAREAELKAEHLSLRQKMPDLLEMLSAHEAATAEKEMRELDQQIETTSAERAHVRATLEAEIANLLADYRERLTKLVDARLAARARLSLAKSQLDRAAQERQAIAALARRQAAAVV